MANEITIAPLARPEVVGAGTERPAQTPSGLAPAAETGLETKGLSLDGERAAEVSRAELEEAVEDLNRHLQSRRSELSFRLDDDSGITIMRVMDMDREEVIRQIPSDETLAILRMLRMGDTKGALLRLNV